MILLAVALGIVIGLSLGALGGGGSILTVPALVYLLGEPARAATTGSLVIVGITALIAVAGHARTRHVRWLAGIIFGLTGVIASYAGTALNHSVNPDTLLLAFAGLIAVAATGMLIHIRHDRTTHPAAPPARARVPRMSAAAVSTYGLPVPDGSGSSFTAAPGHDTGRLAVTPGTAAKVILAGLI
ncbi:MAG: sulfite exporter TauE/SafE family protein, partial [Actinomycetota bacterium]